MVKKKRSKKIKLKHDLWFAGIVALIISVGLMIINAVDKQSTNISFIYVALITGAIVFITLFVLSYIQTLIFKKNIIISWLYTVIGVPLVLYGLTFLVIILFWTGGEAGLGFLLILILFGLPLYIALIINQIIKQVKYG